MMLVCFFLTRTLQLPPNLDVLLFFLKPVNLEASDELLWGEEIKIRLHSQCSHNIPTLPIAILLLAAWLLPAPYISAESSPWMLQAECFSDLFLSWLVFFSFGNPVMEVPVGLPVVSQTERRGGGDSWSHFADRGLMGKRHFQRPNANLFIINQRVGGLGRGRGSTNPEKY